MVTETEKIGDEVRRVKFLSRAGVGRRVEEMIPDVEKLYEEGVKFREGNLVRALPRRGSKKPTTTTSIFGGETTAEKTKREILGCLEDAKAMRIGVHGMGGLGKTTVLEHLHNGLLKPGDKIGSKFDKVIWITASKETSVRDLQDKIGREFELNTDKLKENDNEEIRAKVLLREFNMPKNKRFLLIIDDMWEDYPLGKVGIPELTAENGCKLVLTTRSRDVCSKMECDKIREMGLMSEQEAVGMFLDKVGKSVASDPKLGEIARRVAIECAGLPLAIVTVAGSLRDKTDLIEWEVALTELKDATSSVSSEITAILRFSYDRLKDEKHKECLLHCALYKEDHLIPRDLLIDQLIALGSFEKGRERKEKMYRCHVMLNELVRDCLLIEAVNDIHEKCVKLHDSVRDMAIQIMRENPSRFLVDDVVREEKWDEKLEKVSLMGKNVLGSEPPDCPRLSTLCLNLNGLLFISKDFFTQMKGLCILDLSNMRILRLPDSVADLENISVLLLRNCVSLKFMPGLSKLRNLTRLDLHNADICLFPHGLEKMVKLVYLDLGGIEPRFYPKGLLSKLSELRYLSIALSENAELESAEELTTLKKLETLKVAFRKFNLFNAYLKSTRQVCDFRYKVGYNPKVVEIPNSVSLFCTHLPANDDGLSDLPIAIPTNVEHLTVTCCYVATSLCRLIFVENITKLKKLEIFAGEIEYMFYYSPAVFPLLKNIKELEVSHLKKLRALVGPERDGTASPPPLPLGAFSSLKKLTLIDCKVLKMLFVLDKEASLPDMEEVVIKDCEQLEELIAYENEGAIMEFPGLKSFILSGLPELRSAQFVAESLSHVMISECPKLKEVTASLRPFIGIDSEL